MSPAVQLDVERPAEPMSALRPLVVFLLAPLTVVAIIILIWRVAQLIW
jgi:hypothetical protein